MSEGARSSETDEALAMIGPHTLVWRSATAFAEAAIVDTPSLGRALFLDGVLQSAACDEAEYHRALIEPGLQHLRASAPAAPIDALVLGAGEGATIREILCEESLRSVLAIDIDGELMAAVHEHLGTWHAGAFEDERVSLRIEDARHTVGEADDASFDLIVVDLTDPPDASLDEPPTNESSAPLLETDFLKSLRRVLRPTGVLVVQAGEAEPPSAAGVHSPIPAVAQVFGTVETYRHFIGSFDCEWAFARAFD